ncbi:hypothetical protein vipetofem_2 [Enterococcus phage vipetofem]|uniref:Uncharacterized protein n=1 Tax=Enterococcus phage vipetofem TaxID=2719594 RepID=A0A6G9LKY1_9CAUD|nr:hypothetical protein KNU92_gp002 [Enterococcus phage vipetofem]QIQ66300.1 hypothetical protein vipetofem_2 [Enterococcus phage vipetofem]
MENLIECPNCWSKIDYFNVSECPNCGFEINIHDDSLDLEWELIAENAGEKNDLSILRQNSRF